jgi:tetratricopeptide (TPR) repeat protein
MSTFEPSPAPSPGSDPMIGRQVNQYRIVERLGEGGMGLVYKAEDTSLERTVALKFLPRTFAANSEFEARFMREARTASALDHPNIGVIHEIARSEQGELYIAMAYYGGETLERKIEDGPLPMDEALEYAIQIARGLERAHEGGIIHRDIKPGNVIFTDRGLAKIVDFGLARMEDVTMTRDGTSLGTVAYMSPEQAHGTGVDRRTDLWALGVVLYEMLAGRRPFAGGYEAAILYAAAHEPHASLSALRPEVPEVVSVIVDGLLAKDPESRYQSATEVIGALEAARVGNAAPGATLSGLMPSVPVPAPAAEPDRGRGRLAIVAGASLLGLAAVAVAAWLLVGNGGGPSVSPEARERARAEHDTALEMLSEGRFSVAQARLERSVQLDPEYSAAWSTLAGLHIQTREYLQAVQAGERAVAIDSANSVAWYNLGYALQETGSPEEAADAYRRAIRADRNLQQAYSAMGDVLIELGRPGEAMTVLDEGLRTAPESEIRFLLEKNMGKALLALESPGEALEHLERSLAARPDWPETLLLMARAHAALGNPALARPFRDRFLEVERDPVRRAEADRIFAAIGL